MFAVLSFDRDPLRLQDLPGMLEAWVQLAGGFAAAGVLLWLLIGLPLGGLTRGAGGVKAPAWVGLLFGVFAAAAAVCYLLYFGVQFLVWQSSTASEGSAAVARFAADGARVGRVLGRLLTAAGACALAAVGLPFLRGLAAVRPRRVWALTRLSFKEALRRRVLYAFAAFLLVFLFGSWFLPSKPSDQVRSYVETVFLAMAVLLLIAAGVVAAFSIPADVKQQTVHTILTKPVERFEVVLGRFLGFTALLTLVLAAMTAVSLVYVVRGVDPDAAAESLKARQVLYGDLRFENSASDKKAISVGREWDYRSYISGPNIVPGGAAPKEPEVAVWGLPPVPAQTAARTRVRCEFSFDIYRTTKGEENKGVYCDFSFRTHNFAPGSEAAYRDELKKAYAAAEAEENAQARAANRAPRTRREVELDAADKVAEKYGYYEANGQEITDYTTQSLDVPGGLLRNARQGAAPAAAGSDPFQSMPLKVRVVCKSSTQYVGMAKYDFYVRLDDPEAGGERWAFAANFFKASVGLWARICLLVGLAVALSTYLSGVISLLIAGMLYVCGLFLDFIQSIATGQNIGGGPTEALVRLASGQVAAAPLDETTANRIALLSDVGFRRFIRVVLNLLPDVDRLDLTKYVAEGFNIPADQLLYSLLLLVGYLLPWGVLAYYLMKWREIASSN